jgi:hypothetical protein
MPERVRRGSRSIIAAAVGLLLWSVMIFVGGTWYVVRLYKQIGSINQILLYAHDSSTAIFFLLVMVQIGFGLAGSVTSIGLLNLQERARSRAVFLSTAPVLLVAFALLIFAGGGNGRGAASMTALYAFIVCGCFFLILLPLSIWWFVLFTRGRTRSQFHS